MEYFQCAKSSFPSLTIVLVLLLFGCGETEPVQSFYGEAPAVIEAERMYTAIGGKRAWCELRSLYVKAVHTEPQMSIPYQSEIWRAIDTFLVVIEQQNDSFHVKAVFSESAGSIRYLDDRDTLRTLTADQLKDWQFGHDHNVYVLLRNIACSPMDYYVSFGEDSRLEFRRDGDFVAAFGLDSNDRPYLFYSPGSDGTISGSVFNRWGTDHGLVHSAGGHPLDSNFMYTTEMWQPSTKSFLQEYPPELMELP